MATEHWETHQVDGIPMRAFLVLPDGDGRVPAVVVAQHAGGVDRFIQEMTRHLAASGFAGIAPELYHRQDPPSSGETGLQRMARLRDAEVIADVTVAVDILRHHPRVEGDRIGIKGYCMGGRVAYMMAAARPEAFKACVAFYGGNTRGSWGSQDPTPFERLAQIRCPVLSFFGGEDANPSPDDAFAIDAELKRAGVAHEFHSYPGAGHAYMDFTNASRYNPVTAEASWPIAVAFLRRHLGAVPVSA
ncbi:MAG: dienelactone hydrolase family protein [Chloroflexi bacterium]|nr:dienelactone hydrolase family protein [Chloroflexota bacterium]